MFRHVLLADWGTPAFVINLRQIVTANPVIAKHHKKDVPAIQITMTDGREYTIVEGLNIQELF